MSDVICDLDVQFALLGNVSDSSGPGAYQHKFEVHTQLDILGQSRETALIFLERRDLKHHQRLEREAGELESALIFLQRSAASITNCLKGRLVA